MFYCVSKKEAAPEEATPRAAPAHTYRLRTLHGAQKMRGAALTGNYITPLLKCQGLFKSAPSTAAQSVVSGSEKCPASDPARLGGAKSDRRSSGRCCTSGQLRPVGSSIRQRAYITMSVFVPRSASAARSSSLSSSSDTRIQRLWRVYLNRVTFSPPRKKNEISTSAPCLHYTTPRPACQEHLFAFKLSPAGDPASAELPHSERREAQRVEPLHTRRSSTPVPVIMIASESEPPPRAASSAAMRSGSEQAKAAPPEPAERTAGAPQRSDGVHDGAQRKRSGSELHHLLFSLRSTS